MTEIRNGRWSEGDAGAEPAEARGVTETVLVAGGAPIFLGEHLARFAGGCAHFGLVGAPGAEALRAAAGELLGRSGLSYGVLRWAAWADGAAAEWRMRAEPPRPHMLAAVWRVALSTLLLPRPDADRPWKHLTRRRWREALAAGRAAGWDEVLLADETGGIVEGAISNVFAVRDGVLLTPALAAGPLPGVVRQKVVELAAAEGLPVREGTLFPADLQAAGEIFLTNSLVGIRPVGRLDDRSLPAPGPVTLHLQTAWRRRHGWG